MSNLSFNQLKTQYNRIPLIQKTLADLDTPVSAYLKLANTPYSYLFESVQGGEKWGRYSIIGLSANIVIKIYDKQIKIFTNNKLTEEFTKQDPLGWIEQYQKQFTIAPLAKTKDINPSLDNDELFIGGLVGFFAYDIIKIIEPKLSKIPNHTNCSTPDILLMLSEKVVVFDNLNGNIYSVVLVNSAKKNAYEYAKNCLAKIQQKLQRPLPPLDNSQSTILSKQDLTYHKTEAQFKQDVVKIKQYIKDGDVMQVVLSQQMQLPFAHPPINLYRALRNLNPSPYLFYLQLNEIQIVGSSPEILVRLENNKITVRPIAGTRKRGKTIKEDLNLEQSLLSDPKELAEHLMLIDLGRNDVGRVSKIGTVSMTEKMLIERYSHVMHIVSNVEGNLDNKYTPMDVLKATFPAGTVSGAPKIRAMEIINELETVRRGIYGGAVGYLGWFNNLDTAIAIRTAVIKDKQLFIQAGAGIVHDSDPDTEWEETINKANAVIQAAIVAADNFGDN